MASVDEVWIVDFGEPFPGEPAQQRPSVVVGPTPEWNGLLPYVIVVPLTTIGRHMPELHVKIEPDEDNRLDAVSYAQCELLRSVSERRLIHQVGTVDPMTSGHVEAVIRDLLGY